ncbi:MAG: pantetheine-phosphate adenylyltransferase [Oligoflexales bacterium]|nr:pantetheine-phosphate adenylyltransferase [Oligoflexales bacterium]
MNNKLNTHIKALFPGSFDPITLGHLDIIERASLLFPQVVVGIGVSSQKQNLFSIEERIAMVKLSCAKFSNVEVLPYSELTIDFAQRIQARLLIRGVRNEADFQSESQLALINKHLASNIETIFFPTLQRSIHISSSFVREVAKFKGDLSGLVPSEILELVRKKTS